MIFRKLRPAGTPIRFSGPQIRVADFLPFTLKYFYASGTESLAACLIAAKKHANTRTPEVLLPAYCCPDLISAADFAGIKPVLIDFEFERPWMNLEQLRNSVNKNTIAIVAVNFLGIPERLSEIRGILKNSPVLLISDSAQAFPLETDNPEYDFELLSFARGKPVNLLEGGAVICHQSALINKLPVSEQDDESMLDKFTEIVKTTLYNTIIHPNVYWLTTYTPFLRLGATEYNELDAIHKHSPRLKTSLSRNIYPYIKSTPYILELTRTLSSFSLDAGLLPLSTLCNTDKKIRLLRFPILARTLEERNNLHHDLNSKGLGTSLMYRTPLPSIDGLTERFPSSIEFPNATDFANRLLTLPLHTDVREKDIMKISKILQSCQVQAKTTTETD